MLLYSGLNKIHLKKRSIVFLVYEPVGLRFFDIVGDLRCASIIDIDRGGVNQDERID